MSESVPLPFDDLRRLTGPNLYFAGPGAVLETRVGAPVPTALIEDWKRRIARARAALGWPDGPVTVREHASGASLERLADLLGRGNTEAKDWRRSP